MVPGADFQMTVVSDNEHRLFSFRVYRDSECLNSTLCWLIANSARRAIMQAGRKPTRCRSSYPVYAAKSVVGTNLARYFPDDTQTLMADRRFPAR